MHFRYCLLFIIYLEKVKLKLNNALLNYMIRIRDVQVHACKEWFGKLRRKDFELKFNINSGISQDLKIDELEDQLKEDEIQIINLSEKKTLKLKV